VAAETKVMAGKFDRFLVEEMVHPVVAELIVGLSRDPSFGLTLLVGAGGTLVELVRDTASLLLPASREEIVTALRNLRVARLIDSWRGAQGGNFDAVVDAVAAVAGFAAANGDSIAELDINPLIVLPDRTVAADAVIRTTT
jgi:acetyl-CoA synthetase